MSCLARQPPIISRSARESLSCRRARATHNCRPPDPHPSGSSHEVSVRYTDELMRGRFNRSRGSNRSRRNSPRRFQTRRRRSPAIGAIHSHPWRSENDDDCQARDAIGFLFRDASGARRRARSTLAIAGAGATARRSRRPPSRRRSTARGAGGRTVQVPARADRHRLPGERLTRSMRRRSWAPRTASNTGRRSAGFPCRDPRRQTLKPHDPRPGIRRQRS